MQRFRACVHVIDCYCLGEGSESDGTAYRANREDGVRAVRWQGQAGQGCGADCKNRDRTGSTPRPVTVAHVFFVRGMSSDSRA